jgi:hypothetical protein
LPGGQPAQLVVDQREQLAGRLPLPPTESFENARNFACTAIDRSLLDVGRWMGSSCIGITPGSHTNPYWTRDGRSPRSYPVGRREATGRRFSDWPSAVSGQSHPNLNEPSARPGAWSVPGRRLGSFNLVATGAKGQWIKTRLRSPSGGANPAARSSGCRPGLAGPHIAPLDRRAAERRRLPSVWRSARRSDRPKQAWTNRLRSSDRSAARVGAPVGGRDAIPSKGHCDGPSRPDLTAAVVSS